MNTKFQPPNLVLRGDVRIRNSKMKNLIKKATFLSLFGDALRLEFLKPKTVIQTREGSILNVHTKFQPPNLVLRGDIRIRNLKMKNLIKKTTFSSLFGDAMMLES